MIRIGWAKIIVALVISVAVLQIIHMFLLNKLEATRGASNGTPLARTGISVTGGGKRDKVPWHTDDELQEAWMADRQAMADALQGSSVLDASGLYQIVNYLVQSDNSRVLSFQGMTSLAKSSFDLIRDITLVTHCSPNNLYYLPTLTEHWDGPVSIAVFTTKEGIRSSLATIAALRQCVAAVRLNVSFHLVYPLAQDHVDFNTADMIDKLDCGLIMDKLKSSTVLKNYALENAFYPNNLLRNIARKNSQTEFVFVVDVDMVPNYSLRADFVRFAFQNKLFDENRRDDKTVYVVPAFEVKSTVPEDGSLIADSVSIPRDKAELLPLIEGGLARPFYFELCWKCQRHTDNESWQLKENLDLTEFGAMFEVLWKDPWEPFYIGRNTAPYYDERFKQYGFNRISQICELHVAGYRFSVLNNAFLVHDGWKTTDSFHTRKEAEQEHNRQLFRLFKTELKDKYPNSSRKCY